MISISHLVHFLKRILFDRLETLVVNVGHCIYDIDISLNGRSVACKLV